MNDDEEARGARRNDTRTVDRRTFLRGASAVSAAVLGTTGTGTAAGQSTLAFEADPDDVAGLESAAVRVRTGSDRDRVRHEFAWDPETLADADTAPSASLHLELPDLGLGGLLADPTDLLDVETIARATAVVEEPSSATAGSTLPGIDSAASIGDSAASTGDGDWSLVPYVESTSPLCGTLAETNLRISHTSPSSTDVAYDATDLDTNTYDDTCEDEWYVPREFNTTWYEDASSLDRQPQSVGASTTYYNDDFPESDRVWADHDFEITPSRHEVAYEHSGDTSRLLLEVKSETGYRG